MKKLIAVTGMDGTGKSTLVESLCKTHKKMREVSIWDPMKNGLFQSKQDVDTYLRSLSPNARVQFLSHALTEALAMGNKHDADILLLNGYYYKYFASELALGASPILVNDLMKHFPEPSIVIHLEIPFSTAAERKTTFTQYECGLTNPSVNSFIAFQEKTKTEWLKFDTMNWQKINTSLPIEDVLDKANQIIQNKWS